MVEIAVTLDAVGALKKMILTGHAGTGASGPDLACAAISLLTRSVARLIANRPGWQVDGRAGVPGTLLMAIRRRPPDPDEDEWLRGVTDTLLQALADIDEEYPRSFSVSIEELHDGT